MSLAAFLDEDELNEHEAAWRSKDWDKIEELVKTYTKDKENTLFMVLEELNNGKKPLRISGLDSYDKFFIDNAMSQHIETLIPAYTMNMIGSGLPDQAHFDYYLHTVRKGKRFGAWAKLTEDNEMKVILHVLQKRYGVNTRIAMEYYEELKQLENLDEWKRKNMKVALSVLADVVKNKTDQKKVEQLIKKW